MLVRRDRALTCNPSVILQFGFFGLDQDMASKWPYTWSPGLIEGVFSTIFRAWPVGAGLGAKFGRNMVENRRNLNRIFCFGLIIMFFNSSGFVGRP